MATVTQVASATGSTQLAAANGGRRGLSVCNDSTAVLYLKLGAMASSTSYTTQVPAGGLYELPARALGNDGIGGYYPGVVTGAWAAANGYAYVTEDA